MNIFLDDIRNAPKGFVLARTCSEAIRLISEPEPITILSLDHDLGEGQETGYELMKLLEIWAHEGFWSLIPQYFEIHSANPVGRKNMQAAIDSIERMRNEHCSSCVEHN